VKYFPRTDAPAKNNNGDQQSCRNQQAELQSQEGKNQKAYQRKGTHPYEDGKHHIIEVICKLSPHGGSLNLKLYFIV
jgi:hypothetical protein